MPSSRRKGEVSARCFAIAAPGDRAITTCAFRAASKKNPPRVALKGCEAVGVTLAGSVPLARGVQLDVWQQRVYTAQTDPVDVWDIPLLDVILVYPVILRIVVTNPEAVLPTVGKARKMMCEALTTVVAQRQQQAGDDDDDAHVTSSGGSDDDDDDLDDDDLVDDLDDDDDDDLVDDDDDDDTDDDGDEGTDDDDDDVDDDDDDVYLPPGFAR